VHIRVRWVYDFQFTNYDLAGKNGDTGNPSFNYSCIHLFCYSSIHPLLNLSLQLAVNSWQLNFVRKSNHGHACNLSFN
jgi:hypothetical protein